MNHETALRLSICIATFNRAAFIGSTLDSLLPQLTEECEVVVLDGGSSDATGQIVMDYQLRCGNLRYIRQDMNNGIDQDYDRVVELAQGDYCWLMTDDDLLKEGAVAAVLGALRSGPSLIVVNVEFKDHGMRRVVQSQWLDFQSDRFYAPGQMDQLFIDVAEMLTYIGCVVVRRELWRSRERSRYYGTFYIHVGVIFQQQLPQGAMVVGQPLVSYRTGNAHTWSPHLIDIVWSRWPSLVRSLALSSSAKGIEYGMFPWKNVRRLLRLRASKLYSLREYHRWVRPNAGSARERVVTRLIANLPVLLVNIGLLFYYSISECHLRGVWMQATRASIFSTKRKSQS